MYAKRYACFFIGILLPTLPAQAGTIKGTIRFEGAVPKLRPISMAADPVCHAKHDGENVQPETLVLGEGQTMANILVQIKNPPKWDYPLPEKPAVISQQGCVYVPHVTGLMVNQTLVIENPDGTLHNVHGLAKINEEFNRAMPKFKKTIEISFPEKELFLMKCDVHPWMVAWISVMTHPYFAVTGMDGTYTIDKLPPGEYELEVWHEANMLKTQTRTVTLAGPDDVQVADFTWQSPFDKKADK